MAFIDIKSDTEQLYFQISHNFDIKAQCFKGFNNLLSDIIYTFDIETMIPS